MQLSPDDRRRYVRAIFDHYEKVHGGSPLGLYSSAEYELARKWAMSGVPLATVLQGIREAKGARRLEGCKRSVEENISRWHHTQVPTQLSEPGPLEPFDVAEARRRRDEGLAKMRER